VNYLQFHRLTQGITQADLAERLGIPRTILSRLENGWYARPPEGLNERLHEVFGSKWTFDRLMKRVPLKRSQRVKP
jgi:transcriptional regulator with XRE-family HTH domain